MNITYGDLPSEEACIKLTMVSFSNPKKNLDVYKFANDLKVYQRAFANEKNKLLKQYGTPQTDKLGVYWLGDNAPIYHAKIGDLETSQIDNFNISIPNITEADFEERNCAYPADKTMWLSGKDIGEILEFVKKLKE